MDGAPAECGTSGVPTDPQGPVGRIKGLSPDITPSCQTLGRGGNAVDRSGTTYTTTSSNDWSEETRQVTTCRRVSRVSVQRCGHLRRRHHRHQGEVATANVPAHGHGDSLRLTVPSMGFVRLKPISST